MWALIIGIGTILTGIVGLVLEKRLEAIFQDLRIVAAALIVNGVLLWLGDRLQKARATQVPERLTFRQGQTFLVGLAQIGALIPGFSRSGLTMIAGAAGGAGPDGGNGGGILVPARNADHFRGGRARTTEALPRARPAVRCRPRLRADGHLGVPERVFSDALFRRPWQAGVVRRVLHARGIFFFGWFMTHPQPV